MQKKRLVFTTSINEGLVEESWVVFFFFNIFFIGTNSVVSVTNAYGVRRVG